MFPQDLNYASSWGWLLKPRAQAKEKKLLENFHAVRCRAAASGLFSMISGVLIVLFGRLASLCPRASRPEQGPERHTRTTG